ncbi:MAG: DNA repair protein RecO [Pseudomonadota bacterium]
MEWRDEGILLWVRRHGETNAIIECLTPSNGRHSGLVRGGASKKYAGMLQAGAQLSLEWSARLAEHLGAYKIDLVRGRAAGIMTDRNALAALNNVSAMLVEFLPEREPNDRIYEATLGLVDALEEANPYWPMLYAHWELALLEVLGFGLDLTRCAATGQRGELSYVSPRSGRAVSRRAGATFADRMLPLPQFLIEKTKPNIADVREAVRTTGFFLEKWVCPAHEVKELPPSRARLLKLMADMVMEDPSEEEEIFTEDELKWLAAYEGGQDTEDPAAP